jgi:hypothetical protein
MSNGAPNLDFVTRIGAAYRDNAVAQSTTNVRNRGDLFAPDYLAGVTDPYMRQQQLQKLLDDGYTQQRRVYIPAAEYLIAHPNPLSGLSGLFYYPGQEIYGDGPSSIIKNAVADSQYANLLRPKVIAGVTHSYAYLHDLTIDQNATTHITATATMDITGTQYLRAKNLFFKNICLAAMFCDSPESAPTLGAIIENPTLVNSWATGLSFFGCHEDFQFIGGTFNYFADDAIALQESSQGYPRGHVASETMIFRRGNLRTFVAGVGYSIAHALDIVGGQNINWNAVMDVDDVSAGAVAIYGSRNILPSTRYGAGRRALNISIGTVHCRNSGAGTAARPGYDNYHKDAVYIEDAQSVKLAGGILSTNGGSGIGILNSDDVQVGPMNSQNNGEYGLRAVGSTVKVNGGDYSNNTSIGLFASTNSKLEVNSLAAGDSQATKTQAYALYAQSGAVITGNDVKAIGLKAGGTPLVNDGGTVLVTGIRTADGPLESRGSYTFLSGTADIGAIPHGLNQKPTTISVTLATASPGTPFVNGLTATGFDLHLSAPAPAAGVTVNWRATV